MNESITHWAGIDVSEKTFDISIVFHGQHYPETPLCDIPAEEFPRSPEGVAQSLQWLDGKLSARGAAPEEGLRAVMEATGKYSLELTAWLLEQRPSLLPAIVNAQRARSFLKSMGLRGKTDKIDARGLGFYGVERRPAAYEPLTPELETLRKLSRYRDFLVAEQTAASNREDVLESDKTVRQMAKRRAAQYERDIKKIEKAMREHIGKSPDLKRDYDLLTSIPGVGFVTACVMLAELGDLRRFGRARQLTAFAGLCPSEYDSGDSVHKAPRMSKCGNARARQALYMAALTASRMAGPLKDDYTRMIGVGKARKAALGMVMRKLLVLMRAVLKSAKPYDKNFRAGGKPCG